MIIKKCVTQTRMWLKSMWLKGGLLYQNMLQPKQCVLSFGEILHHGDKNKTNVIHT